MWEFHYLLPISISRYFTLILILQNGHLKSFCSHSYQHPEQILCIHSVLLINFLLNLHTGHSSNWSTGTIFYFLFIGGVIEGFIFVLINICFSREINVTGRVYDGFDDNVFIYGFYYSFYSTFYLISCCCWLFFIYSIIDFSDGLF